MNSRFFFGRNKAKSSRAERVNKNSFIKTAKFFYSYKNFRLVSILSILLFISAGFFINIHQALALNGRLIYGSGGAATISQREWRGDNTLGSPFAIQNGPGNNSSWQKLRSSPTTFQFAAAAQSGGIINIQFCNNTSTTCTSTGNWSVERTINTGTNADYYDMAYEQTSGDLLLVVRDGQSDFHYYTRSSAGSWSGPLTSGIGGGINGLGTIQKVKLYPDPTSDRIILAYNSGGGELGLAVWNGTAWETNSNHRIMSSSRCPNLQSSNYNFDAAWLASGSRLILVCGNQGGSTHISYTSSTGWSSASAMPASTPSALSHVKLSSNPYADIIAMVGATTDLDLAAITGQLYNGGWSTSTAYSKTLSNTGRNGANTRLPVDIAWNDILDAVAVWANPNAGTLTYAKLFVWPNVGGWTVANTSISANNVWNAVKIYNNPDPNGNGEVLAFASDSSAAQNLYGFSWDQNSLDYLNGSWSQLSPTTISSDVGSSDAAFDLEFTPPIVTSVTGQNPQTTAGGKSITISGRFFASSTVTINNAEAAVTAITSSSITATAPANPAGTYSLKVTNPVTRKSFTLSNAMTYIAPPASLVLNETYTSANSTSSRTLTGTGLATSSNSGCPIKIITGATSTDTGTCATSVSGNASSLTSTIPSLSAGSYSLRAYGASGNFNNGIYTDTPIYYRNKPTNVTSTIYKVRASSSSQQITFTGLYMSTGTTPMTIGSASATYSGGTSSSLTVTVPNLVAGRKDVRVYGDGGNNSNGVYTDYSQTIVYIPQIISVTPNEVSAAGGITVTISGRDMLVGSGGVKIDTTTTTTSGTTSTITFNTPAHATGTVTVRVYGTPSGTDANEVYATTTITYTGPPSYTVDDPYLLSNVTSTRTITGTGIGVNSSCPIQYKIAANPTSTFSCIPVISTTSNSVVVEIPARNAGQLTTTANLRVFGVNGTSSNGIYTDSLIYHSSQPTDIVIDNPYVSANTSGTQRLIQGWNVSSSTYPAKVLGGASTTFVSATSSFGFFSVTTEMPNLDPGLYDLRVYGQGGNDSNGIYTDLSGFIVYAPYVESVSPTTLSAVGGETVTITGRGLKVGDSGVRIFTPGGTNYLRDTAGDANISVTYTTPPSSSGGTSTLRIFGEGGNDSNEIYVETSTLYVAPVYNQSSFRWFQNANSATPGTPLADINTSTTFTNAGEQVRLRMTIDLSVIQSPAGDSFLLQVASSTGACSSGLNYTSVLGGGNGNDILFYNNSNVLDGSSFVATSTDPTHSGHTNVAQTYEEEVGFSSINTINVGNDGIWDFSLQNNSAKRGLTYCFRIVKNDGSFTPLNNYGVYPSISVVNIAPEVQNVTASQNASGTVNISYETRDPDSDSGAANPGFVTPSFDYWNGSSWVNIASSSLEAFDLVAKSITSSSFTQHTATWTPVNQIPGVYNTGAQIRVTVNDGEATKNTATSTSNTYTLDTTDPVVTTATFDSRNDLLHLNSSDNQTLTYLLSNNSNFSADGLNASSGIHISAGGTSVSSTLSWNASGTPSYERIYVWFQDAVNNIASTTIITPTLPSSFVLADDSNPGAGFYAETLSWSPHTNITSSTAQYYEVWRSINNTSSFTLHATTTNAFFNDTGLSGSNTYFYKLAVRSTQGNYSEYSATLGDRPDGSGTSSDTSFAPDFDTTFDSVNQTGVSIYQSTSSNNSNWGQVLISYKVRDRDNTSGTINPSYEYNLGSGWIAISSSTMNATSTDAKTVSSSSFTTHTVSWNAKQQIPGTYSTNLRVRVTANDGLMAGSSESAPKTLDTVAPTITSTTLKINGFTANAEATSSAAYLVQIQNVSHQPTDETIYPAITTDLSNFYQLLGNGTVATNTNTYYTSLSSSSLTGTSWTWTNGGSLLYLYLTDNVNNVATDTISVIGVNDAPEIQSISTYQATSSTPTAGGQVIISYSARDTDNTTNTPTFAYNLGAGWITIPSSTLNSTATNPLSVSSSYQSFTASWSATSTVSSTYNTAVQIRLTLSDNQGVNSSTIATSSFILDTIGPSLSSSSLLINGSPASSESTSTLISLSLQNVSSTPNPETIFVQFSDDDGNTWYGANSNGTLTTSTWGSGISSNTTTTWSLNISGRARTISTRATDAYGNTISTDTNTVGYNQSPEFNSSYGTGGLVVLQDATSTNPTWGQVLISYGVRDTDTSVGSSTPNEITPSFSFNYGSGWTDITSGFLGANDLEDKGVDQSIFTTHTATWNATSQAPGVYSNNLQLRVRVSDNETVASTSESILSNITLDTKVPVANSFRLDSRTNHIIHSFADDSLLSYRFSNNSNLSADGFNTSSSLWNDTLATTSVASTSWIPNVSSSLEKIYYEVRDRYGNIASGSAAAPLAPSSTTIQDVSNTNTASFAELISWSVYNSTSAAPFAAYEVYVSTSSASDGFSLLASITDNSQNFYRHNNLASSTTYYYKVSTKTSNNDYSDYSSVVSDQPDGLSGAAAEGPIISNIQAAEVHASWARITWDTDRLSNSKVEYGTSTNYSSQTSTVSLVIGHEIFIDGLTQNSDYNFRVTSVDINNKQTVSDNYTFTTTGGPIISAVSTQSVTDNTATITWNTNKDANSTVIYSTLLQNLRNNSGTLNAGNSSLVGGPPYQHRVTLPALTQQTSYYYYVQSTDNTNNTTADKKNGDYYTFTTTQDTKAPIISNVQVAATTQNAAVITWNTDELTTSQVFYDTRNVSSSQFASFTTRDEILTTNHAVTLTALQPLTTYFYDVRSVDAAGNPSKSEEKSFATSDSVQTIILASGGGAPPSPAVDTTPPTISDIEIVKIEPFGAEISFKTNEPTVGFISFGETNAYGRVTANPEFKSKHTLALRGLKLGTTYHFQIKAQDKSGNFATADDQKLTTLYAVEDFNNLISLDSVEQFENQIENLIESITPSLITPFIGKIEITDITENSATVKWETNTNTFGSVAYVAENDFDSEKENPYATEISDSQPKTTKHQVTLNNLAPGTLYHFQIKSFTLPEVVGKSADRTFITRSLKIRPQVSNLQNTSFAISWQTSKFTSSFVEFTNTKTNQVDRTGTDEKSTTHVVNVQNLTPNTAYRVKAFGYDENQNIVESETITVTTSRDVIAPEISALKIDNTFVPGRNDRIQTVVSWKTDEPAISQVFYEEGSGRNTTLANVASSTSAYNLNHNVIITNFRPGTIYRIQVVSTDAAGNVTRSPIRAIITPQQTRSVFDVILKNFEDSFRFLQ